MTPTFNQSAEDARAPDEDYYGDDDTTFEEAIVLPVKQEEPQP